MSAASNYLENAVLDHVLKNTAYTQPTTLRVALFSGTAADVLAALEAGTASATAGNWGYYEVLTSGTAYGREAATFSAASGGSATTSANITFSTATANYDNTAGSGSTITCIAIVDNATVGSGNVLFYGQLDNPKEVLSGDTFQVSAGNLTVSLA